MQNKSQFIFIFEREYLLQRRKIVFFIDTAKFSGKKHLRAGECQGAKKNEEKDTKKTEAAIGLPFSVLFFKSHKGSGPA